MRIVQGTAADAPALLALFDDAVAWVRARRGQRGHGVPHAEPAPTAGD